MPALVGPGVRHVGICGSFMELGPGSLGLTAVTKAPEEAGTLVAWVWDDRVHWWFGLRKQGAYHGDGSLKS